MMRFSLAALELFCAAASATTDATGDFDSIFKPEKDQIVKAGSTVDVAWSIKNKDLYGDVKVDILVYAGKDDKSLVLKDSVATKVDNSDLKYKWNVDSALGSEKMYGVRIQLSSNETVYQWSNHFTIKNEGGGGGGGSSSTASESSATSGTESATGGSSSTKSTTTTSAATTSASTSTSKGEHTTTTTAPSSASATSATMPTTSSTSTAVSTVTTSPTQNQAAAAGLTARAGVAGAIVGCVAVLAL